MFKICCKPLKNFLSEVNSKRKINVKIFEYFEMEKYETNFMVSMFFQQNICKYIPLDSSFGKHSFFSSLEVSVR